MIVTVVVVVAFFLDVKSKQSLNALVIDLTEGKKTRQTSAKTTKTR